MDRAMSKDISEYPDQIWLSFIEELRRLRLQAGRPTFKEMEGIAKRTEGIGELPPSTTSDILKGKRVRIPALPWLLSFVTVCHICAEQPCACFVLLVFVVVWCVWWFWAFL